MFEEIAVIPLSHGKFAIIDREDLNRLGNVTWTFSKDYGRKDPAYGYAVRAEKDKKGKSVRISMHRLIAGTPKGMACDHINGDPLDNRKSNLRNITQAENLKNRGVFSNNKSGITGVSQSKDGTWRASIIVECGSLDEAQKVRAMLEYVAHGQYARKASLLTGPRRLTPNEIDAVWRACGSPVRQRWQRQANTAKSPT